MKENNSYKKLVAMILFLASGFISLIFQVAWLKMLVNVFGNTVWATSTLLTVFMAGLAGGSWLFGRIADRTGSPLRLYGLLEGFIGVYGLLTPLFFFKLDALYIPLYSMSGGDNVMMGFFKFFMALVILLPPTLCMGATLPLLARQFTRTIRGAGSGIGSLYTINTMGAVLGTFAAGFVLIPMLGLTQTIRIAAGISFIILITSFLLTYGENARFKLKGLFQVKRKKIDERWVLVFYFFCGLTALAYEVIWTRIMTLHLGSSVYAYSAMLAGYLLGVTLGAGLMSYYIKRIKNSLTVFAVIQFLIALDLILIINQFGMLSRVVGTMGEVVAGESYAAYVFAMVTGTLQLLLIPTLLFGASFPLAVRLFVKRKTELGKETGSLYAANTFGTILGAFCAGFVLLPLLGAQTGLLVIASINLLMGIYLVFRGKGVMLKKLLVTAFVLILFYGGYFLFTQKDQALLSALVFKDSKNVKTKLLAFEEDIYATVTVAEREEVRGTWRQLSLNGVDVAGTSCELFSIQKLQGHLPLFLHPNPRSVLHIGFGSGGTAWAVSRHPVEKIVVAEISRSIIEKSSRFFRDVNHGVLEDPRLEVVYTDGRNKVLADTQTYDVILSDSIHPRFSGNGSLYTCDYYRLLKKRLNPGGVVSQWLPFYSITPENFKMIVRSFYEVFPNTTVWFANNTVNAYVIVIGKLGSGTIDYAAMERKLALPEVQADLKEIDCHTTYKILDFFLFGNEKVKEFTGDVALHTDDNMAVEYLSGKSLSKSITSYLNYISLMNHRTPIDRYLVNLENASVDKKTILDTIGKYWIATTYNLTGQRFLWEGRLRQAFEQFDYIPASNPDDKEPVEYFGASYQEPFLKRARLATD